MADSFISYPTLDEKKINALGYVSEIPVLGYVEDYEEHPLQLELFDDSVKSLRGKVKDVRAQWYPDTHNLIISKKLRITNAYTLFGEGGVVGQNSVVGIAFRWISSKSFERGVVRVGELTRKDSSKEFTGIVRFDKGKIKGSLQIQTIIYLKKTGRLTASESYYAQRTGTVLGVIDNCEIYVDGNGSIFPISTVSAPGKPLWWVRYNELADPMVDSFDYENVDIQINQAHPNYEALKIETSMYESPLFLEVISSALVIIVESVKETLGENWDTMLAGEEYESGSIAEAINHFSTRLGWDFSSAAKLAVSIKEFFENSARG